MKQFGVVVCLALVACVLGCSPVNIRCKVLEGELSTMTVVGPGDPRFKEVGIEGAEITVRQTGRTGDVVVRTTNKDGNASIPLAGTGALSRPMGVEVRAPGYLPAVIEQMPTPTSQQRLLILLEPIQSREP